MGTRMPDILRLRGIPIAAADYARVKRIVAVLDGCAPVGADRKTDREAVLRACGLIRDWRAWLDAYRTLAR